MASHPAGRALQPKRYQRHYFVQHTYCNATEKIELKFCTIYVAMCDCFSEGAQASPKECK
jgi:hypothetical protein